MKKLLLALVATCGAAYLPAASADVIRSVHLDFESGATFDGALTFADGYAGLLDVDGTLAGGLYGTQNINWAWWAGTGQANPQDFDGNAATYEDWLMNGIAGGAVATSTYSYYIGVSWYTTGALTFNLTAPVYNSGVNSADRITAARTVPEPLTLTMLGAGLIGLALTRRRRTNA
jgi:PEP-CTERM motif